MMMMTKSFATFKGDERKTKDDKTSMLERLALSQSEADFEKALIKGSDLQRFFSLLLAINKAAPDQFADAWPSVEAFCADVEKSGQGKVLRYEVMFKYLLHRISAVKDDQQRQRLMAQFNSVFLGAPLAKPRGLASEAKTESAETFDVETRIKQLMETAVYKMKESEIKNLPMSTLRAIDLEKLRSSAKPEVCRAVLACLDSLDHLADPGRFFTGDAWTLQPADMRKMTVAQLLKTSADSTDFVVAVLAKSTQAADRYSRAATSLDRQAVIRSAIACIDTQLAGRKAAKDVRSLLQAMLLTEMAGHGDVDVDLLKDYLRNDPVLLTPNLAVKPRPGSQPNLSRLSPWPGCKLPDAASLDEVLKKLVWQSVTRPAIRDELAGFVRSTFLDYEFARASVQHGQTPASLGGMTDIEMNELRDEVRISIRQVSELGVVHADIKNVPRLAVRVFEINTVNYYLQRQAAFDDQIDLDGVVATETRVFEYSQPPAVLHRENFEIEVIARSNRGLFVVDLVGQGVNSRAVVKRGGLNLIQTDCQTGHRFCVVDETRTVCRGPATRLVLADAEHKADDDGWIDLPFQHTAVNRFALVAVGDYAEPVRLQMPAADLRLLMAVAYNEEALAPDHATTLVVSPRLMTADGVASLELLASKLSVTILTITSDGLRLGQHVANCRLNEGHSISVEYKLPAKAVSVAVTLDCWVDDRHLTANHRLDLGRCQSSAAFDLALLPTANGELILQAACANGQPLTDAVLQVNLKLAVDGSTVRLAKAVDKLGCVGLGRLPGVSEVEASCSWRDSQVTRRFSLDARSRFDRLPAELGCLEGEDVMLPAIDPKSDRVVGALQGRPFAFLRVDPSFADVIEDCSADVETAAGMVYLTKLRAGHYRFTYYLGTAVKTVRLTVWQGCRWDRSPDHILTASMIARLQNQANYLTFDQAAASDTEATVQVFSNRPESARVTLLAFEKLPCNLDKLVRPFDCLQVTEACSTVSVSGNCQAFMNNRQMAEEQKYISDRGQATAAGMGSTLAKPTGLLAQEVNRSTVADSVGAMQAKTYESRSGWVPQMPQIGGLAKSTVRGAAETSLLLSSGCQANKGVVVGVKAVDADGKVSFDIGMLPESLRVLVMLVEDCHNFVVAQVVRSKPFSPTSPTVDLRLAQSMTPGLVRHVTRTTRLLKAGETGQPTGQQHAVVEDFGQVFDMLQAFGCQGLGRWQFLKAWPSLSESEKQALYEDYAGHEMHVFLYCKDPIFFAAVRRHLANKPRPDLVDLCLLGDVAAVKAQATIGRLAALLPWEAVLVYWTTKDPAIERFVKSQAAAGDKSRRFDSVLSYCQGGRVQDSNRSVISGDTGLDTGGRAFMNEAKPAAKMAMMAGRKAPMPRSSEGGYEAVGSCFEFKETYYRDTPTGSFAWDFWKETCSQLVAGTAVGDVLTDKFITASGNTAEAIFMLAMLGLRFDDKETGRIIMEKSVTMSNQESEEKDSVLVAQVFYDKIQSGNSSRKSKAKAISKFVKGRIYETKATVTNISDNSVNVDLILEIPQGAIPIGPQDYFVSRNADLNQFQTHSASLSFYFPSTGDFTVYPASVAMDGKLMKFAAVADRLTVVDSESLIESYSVDDMVSKNDTKGILLELSKLEDKHEIDGLVSKVFVLLADRQFYESLIAALREKMVFSKSVWSQSMLHGDVVAFAEYLSNELGSNRRPIELKDFTLYYLNTPVLKVDTYEAKEYAPLVNARTHFTGQHRHNIANKEFLDTYMHFLKYYLDKSPNDVDPSDRLLFAVYLVMQDRQAEASDMLARIKTPLPGSALRLQVDYLTVYSLVTSPGLTRPSIEQALKVCQEYADYPVLTWRQRFAQVTKLLEEIDGKDPVDRSGEFAFDADGNSNIQTSNAEKAARHPSIRLEQLANDRLVLHSSNVESVDVKFCIVDIETKFSLNPFDSMAASSAGIVRPHFESTLQVAKAEAQLAAIDQTPVTIPAHLSTFNLTVQASVGALSVTADYLPSKIVLSTQGREVQALVDGKPLEGLYVKIYCQKAGQTSVFFKDGYTNKLGRFEFTTLNTGSIFDYSSAAMIGISKSHGAVILKLSAHELQAVQQSLAAQTPSQSTPAERRLLEDAKEAVARASSKYAVL